MIVRKENIHVIVNINESANILSNTQSEMPKLKSLKTSQLHNKILSSY